MHAFLWGLGVGIFGGGALSYLYASKVIGEYKAIAAKASNLSNIAKKL